MKIERFHIQSCCGKMAIIFKTDQPLTVDFIDKLSQFGFVESLNFRNAGIIYMDNPELIISGPVGSDRLTVKCKIADCSSSLNNLEELISKIG